MLDAVGVLKLEVLFARVLPGLMGSGLGAGWRTVTL